MGPTRWLAEADAEVVAAAQAVIRTVRVLAAEKAQVVHEKQSLTTGHTVDSVCEVLYHDPWRSAMLGGHHRLWLRWQPGSALSQWYQRRFGAGNKRARKVGIVALARKLLIALWRYVERG